MGTQQIDTNLKKERQVDAVKKALAWKQNRGYESQRINFGNLGSLCQILSLNIAFINRSNNIYIMGLYNEGIRYHLPKCFVDCKAVYAATSAQPVGHPFRQRSTLQVRCMCFSLCLARGLHLDLSQPQFFLIWKVGANTSLHDCMIKNNI